MTLVYTIGMPRQKMTFKNITAQQVQVMRARMYKGIFARVARQMRPPVSPSVVCRVGLGLATSERIMSALIRECKRIEQVIERMDENVA